MNVTLVALETLKSNHFTYYPPSKSNNYFAIKLNTVWALFFADRVNFPFLSCLSGGQNKSGRTKVSNQSISGHSGQLLGTYMYILPKTIDHYNFPRDFNVQKIGFYLSQKHFLTFPACIKKILGIFSHRRWIHTISETKYH